VKTDEHHTPDGRFTLLVKYEDDDISIGFAGFEWHTHGDLLAGSYPFGEVSGLTPETATRRFVEDIVSNRAVIAVIKAEGSIRDVWITDDIEKELRHKRPDEEIEFRYWDGTDART
jgi:hypothetical protein